MENTTKTSAYEALLATGFEAGQARVYETLLSMGRSPASKIAQKSGLSRPLCYKVLGELEREGLVIKNDEPGRIALFSPAHPLSLREMTTRRIDKAKDAQQALEGSLATLVSTFNLTSGEPGVRILEGVRGVAELYEDILNERKDIRLIRSPQDDTFPELGALVEKQIEDQKKLGIHVRAITPLAEGTSESVTKYDAERLVTRRIVPAEKFNTPAQIILYANKVALTSYDQYLMTTVIDNPAIYQTIETLFEFIWDSSTDTHNKLLDAITKPISNS